MSGRLYEVRDPIHNFLLFDDLEKVLINSAPVQRLRRIKQLALTCEVYPGAMHSRFEHSLGTMEFASQAFDSIVKRGSDALAKLNWSEAEKFAYRQTLRVGALLHDIGHAPFSHAPEALLPEGFAGHESFTDALIHSDFIRPRLSFGVVHLDPDQVAAVALGPEKKPQEDPSLQLLQEIVAGDLGVDRMDYLIRDALHTGAAAGRFDYYRLLNTLTVIAHPATGSPVLALEVGGRHSAEALLLARYFMFRQVYFHDVRRIYDCHLIDFLAEYLPGGHFPEKLDEFLRLDDCVIETAINEASSQTGRLSELAMRLRGRNHFRVVYELRPEQRAQDPEIMEALAAHLRDTFGDYVRVDEVGKESHTLEGGKLYLVRDNGELEDILEASELIRSLKPVWEGRIYSHSDCRAEVGKASESFIQGRLAA